MPNNFKCNSFNNERLRGSHSIVRLFGTLGNKNVTFIRFLTGTIFVRRSHRYCIKDKVDSMIDCRSKTKKWEKRRKDEMKKISVSLDSLQLQFIYNKQNQSEMIFYLLFICNRKLVYVLLYFIFISIIYTQLDVDNLW